MVFKTQSNPCSGTCPKPKCTDTDESLSLESEGQLTTIEQEGANDPFDRPEDDTVTTSTSVYVAQPGSAASGKILFHLATKDKMTWLSHISEEQIYRA